ncbi:dipeptidyl carboxypeptidase [Rhodanobacter sp. FW510-R12]|uniref:peptidyl-dipeptidase Dcp n=1 Tax=unclassified Rhodanobacter TaxID=2621553 RepID=UPI0007AA4EFA|nr:MULTISPECIES: peptidyl-dipeptidase Dcp [unclassified Rhodanobacter]KZC18050.1 dipeptidyl carboxypeptidase [Rhodanobacter sp. FW104-R8]KZC28236.1 dipeptidyl carboxypeptidase [Rhodanobacter sp. FW510-T8]KZC33400.1 dipeptidyl carboxypeptidase [Rhodanobacter sp. FW510-R10]
MFRLRTIVIATTMALAACSQQPNGAANSPAPAASAASAGTTAPAAPAMTSNPFYSASTLPFQAPPFDRIKDADYQPAIEEGMRQHLAEIEKIANDPAAPTFENTFVAMEKSGAMLNRVMAVFGAVTGANTDDALQKVQEDEAPRLAAHQDAIHLNGKLFQRVEAIYNQRDTLRLDPESARLVEVVYKNFVHAGAKLSDADKAKLKDLNKEESTLSTAFTNKLLAATRDAAPVVADRAKLAGLSDAELAAAAQAGKDRKQDGKYVLTLQNTTQQPGLQDLTDRDTRQALFEASWNRAEKGDASDTRKTIERLAQIRAEQAKLLGYPDYAAWKLDDQMAKTPETALKFMQNLVPAVTARAQAEAGDIQALIDKQHGGFKLAPWDWNFYAEQVRKAKYDLDASQIKPYFELDNVLQNGVFYAANQLYGLTFKERHDIPVYQPDVRVFEVFDKDGSSLALFYCDYFKRDNKNGGAWMDNFVQQSKLLGTRPVIFNVANFAKPAAGQPALLSFDDVVTMFHEFGHALHGIFADEQYPTLSGTATARDFVEFPSQFNEHWATDPKIFANYAKHYQTGAPMPQALVDKVKKAGKFNKGYDMTELVAAALLDMNWHMLGADAPLQDADRFEAAALKKDGIDLGYVPPRYRSSYFQHIWGNGYAAGYYAYLWTQMLADDAFVGFKEHGGLTRGNGDRFRAMVLSRGNTEELAKMYRDWRGQDPQIEPMLENRGLKDAPKP